MFHKRLAIAALAAAAIGLAGCERSGSDSIHSTPLGVFYTPWYGGLFQIENSKLVAIAKSAAGLTSPKTLQFSEKIPGLTDSGFPVVVTGAAKFGDGQRRIKIDLALGALGNKQPSIADQAAFVAGLRNGNGRLKSINLSFLDSDNFLASQDKFILIGDTGWTGETSAGGAVTQYEFLSTEPSSPDEDHDTASIDVKWSQTGDSQPSPTPATNSDAAAAASDAEAAAADAAAAASAADPNPNGGGPAG